VFSIISAYLRMLEAAEELPAVEAAEELRMDVAGTELRTVEAAEPPEKPSMFGMGPLFGLSSKAPKTVLSAAAKPFVASSELTRLSCSLLMMQ
jgi:hypothetical protein